MTDPTRERLIEAAEQVFAAKGFEAASVREICKEAGANIAAVNYYFRDKERLYIEAVKFAHRGCAAQPFPDSGPTTPAVDKLREFIRTMMARVLAPQSPTSLQLMMREMAQPTAACVEVVQDYIRPIALRLGAILAELLPDSSEQQRMLVAFSVVGQCHFYRNQRAVAALLVGEENFRQLNVDIVADHICRFTLAALGLETPLAGRRSAAPRRGVKP